jgi:hypothetical protein
METKTNYQEYDMNIHEKFLVKLDELRSKGVTQVSIAEQIGVSDQLLTGYKGGYYNGDIKKLEAKIKTWLERLEREANKIEIPYVQINATKPIFKVINSAQRDRDFGIIVGKAGTSKSMTIAKYIEQNKGTLYIKINRSSTGALIRSLASQLGIAIKGGNISVYENIVNYLKGKNWVIIVDEADYLKENCLQLLRNISDDAEIGIVLAGLPRLINNLLDQKEDHQQLVRRVGTVLDLSIKEVHYTIQDAEKILRAVWKDISHEIISLFFEKSKNCIGTLTKLMVKSHEIAQQNAREKITIDDVNEASKVVMRSSNILVR